MTRRPKGKKLAPIRSRLDPLLVPGARVLLTPITNGALNVFSTKEDVEVKKLGIPKPMAALQVSRLDSWVLLMVPSVGLFWTTVGNLVQFEVNGGVIDVDRFDAA